MKIGSKPFIVGEISGNHDGDRLKAIELIKAAKICGCDAVKIQLYEPEDLNDPANYHIYQKYKTPHEWVPRLFEVAKEVDIPLQKVMLTDPYTDPLTLFKPM